MVRFFGRARRAAASPIVPTFTASGQQMIYDTPSYEYQMLAGDLTGQRMVPKRVARLTRSERSAGRLLSNAAHKRALPTDVQDHHARNDEHERRELDQTELFAYGPTDQQRDSGSHVGRA